MTSSSHSPPRQRSETRNTTVAFLALSLEQKLDPELLGVLIEPGPEAAIATVDFSSLQLERARLVRLRGDEKVLVGLVRRFNLLLIGSHEPDPRHDRACRAIGASSGTVARAVRCRGQGNASGRYLRVLELEQQADGARDGVSYLRDLVPRPTDLDDVAAHAQGSRVRRRPARAGPEARDGRVERGLAVAPFLGLPGRTAGQVGLVLPALGVGQVRAVVLVHGQT